MGILVTTSVTLLLFAIMAVWVYAQNITFQPGGVLADKNLENGTVMLLLMMFAFGTGKAALFPFHKWLPNAMVAPTPVSALLHAVAVVKAGVFTILKVVIYIFGLDLLQETGASEWLMAIAAFTILFSSCVALTKDNLKARLAYSTISQLSYIVLGAAFATTAGVLGGALHIVMHAVGKITLFFCAGAIIVFTHKNNISEMDGLGRKMPWTMGAFTIGSFSIIGVPPFGGMWSKWFLGQGALESGSWMYMSVFLISSLLSIGYLMPIVGRAYFRKPSQYDEEHLDEMLAKEKGNLRLCVVPLCATAVGCALLFLFPTPIYELLLPIFEEVSR